MMWTGCELIETVPGKMSGAPLVLGTRVPVSALIENYEAFREEGMNEEDALAETAECYPSARVQTIRAILDFYYSHQPQLSE